MEYDYKIVLDHEAGDHDREINLNNYESAEKTFWMLLKGLESETGNFTLTLYSNREDKVLCKLEKDL